MHLYQTNFNLRLSMKQVFSSICAGANLALAYSRFSRCHGQWAAGVPMHTIHRNPVKAMLELSEQVRGNDYQPQKPAVFNIQKADGTQRKIAVFAVRDRVVQRAVLQVVQLASERLFLPSSFGFRPGRGVRHALAAAAQWVRAGYGFAVDADIRQCFDHIPHAPLLRRVSGLLADERATALVERCMGATHRGSDTRGLAQGACLSPWLCNLYLHSFDAANHSTCTPLVRCADDFVLFARSWDGAQAALIRARAWMQRNGLELHPAKTRLLRPTDPLRFLGAALARPALLLSAA